VKVFSFTLILSLDFMLRISSFLETESSIDEGFNVDAQTENNVIRAEVIRRKRSEVGNQHQSQSKTITLSFHVEEYDVVLVEKMDDINCLALILNVSLSFFL
jgi:vacuolar protein sorting-associated protein 13A/C